MHAAEERQWWYAGMRAISFVAPGSGVGGTATPRPGGSSTAAAAPAASSAISPRAGAPSAWTSRPRRCGSRRAARRGRRPRRADGPALPGRHVRRGDQLRRDLPPLGGATTRPRCARWCASCRPGGLLLLRVPALKMLWGAHDEAVHSRHRYTRGEVRRLLDRRRPGGRCATYANSLLFPRARRAPHARPPHRPPRLGRGLPARAAGMGVPAPRSAWRRGSSGTCRCPWGPASSPWPASRRAGAAPRLESRACGAAIEERIARP